MHKSAVLLIATAFAIVAGPAFAATTPTCATNVDLTDIDKKVAGPVCTSKADNGSAHDILIDTDGVITEAPVSGLTPTIVPALTIDSSNLVTDKGLINFVGTNNAIGVQLNTGNTGGIDINVGTIDMRQGGTDKFGILITDPTSGDTGTFTGVLMPDAATPITTRITAIDLEAGSTLEIQGDGSAGIDLAAGNTLVGDIDIGGTITLTPTKTGETSATTTSIGTELLGTMTGNFDVMSGGEISVEGPGAEGVVVTGALNGAFINSGIISVEGTSTPSVTKTTNPVSGSAVVIENNVTGGILNDGPVTTGGVGAGGTAVGFASITGSGGSTSAAVPVLEVAATTSDVVIGPVTDAVNNDTITGTGYSLLNRGSITTNLPNPDISSTAITIAGSATSATMDFTGGIFNSGTISALSTTKTQTASSVVTAIALDIGSYTTIPDLVNSNQSAEGSISASVSGVEPGIAQAILINATSSSLKEIDNSQGAIISASAITADNTNTALEAFAIDDLSGTLTTINNQGTISAIATTLTNEDQIAAAIFATSQNGVTITNGGTITGDVILGGGVDTLTIAGSSTQAASVSGNLYFGGDVGAPAGSFDKLSIGNFGSFTGQIEEPLGSLIDISVAPGGSLTIANNGTSFDPLLVGGAGTCPSQPQACGVQADNFTTANGSNLNVDVAEVFNQDGSTINPPAIIGANSATIADGTKFSVGFGSFISAQNNGNSQFVLVGTPTGALDLGGAAGFQSLQNDVEGETPFLFSGSLCTVNVTGSTTPCTTVPKDVTGSALILELDPRVPVANCTKAQTQTELCMHGLALDIFNHANAALSKDTALGAAVISAGLPVNGQALTAAEGSQLYQNIYSEFAPDVTGSARALGISLTDQGTGEVGARQRALRMYAGQDGDTTIWGQEFTQNLNVGSKTVGGYDDTGFGFVLGADSGTPRNGRYGVAFQFYSGDTHEKSPRTDSTNSEWLLLSGYTDWRGRGFFLDSQATIGYAQLKGQRFITVGPAGDTVSRDARGDRGAEFLSGGVTSGVLLSAGGTVFTPQISLDGLTMREEGYQETSNTANNVIPKDEDGFDLIVKPNYMNSLRAFAGADLRQDLNLGSFFLQPEVRAGYRYDFIDGEEKVKAAFVSETADPANYFTITGPDPARGNLVLGGGLAVTTGAWSVGVSYDYIKGFGGTTTLDQVGTFTIVGRM